MTFYVFLSSLTRFLEHCVRLMLRRHAAELLPNFARSQCHTLRLSTARFT